MKCPFLPISSSIWYYPAFNFCKPNRLKRNSLLWFDFYEMRLKWSRPHLCMLSHFLKCEVCSLVEVLSEPHALAKTYLIPSASRGPKEALNTSSGLHRPSLPLGVSNLTSVCPSFSISNWTLDPFRKYVISCSSHVGRLLTSPWSLNHNVWTWCRCFLCLLLLALGPSLLDLPKILHLRITCYHNAFHTTAHGHCPLLALSHSQRWCACISSQTSSTSCPILSPNGLCLPFWWGSDTTQSSLTPFYTYPAFVSTHLAFPKVSGRDLHAHIDGQCTDVTSSQLLKDIAPSSSLPLTAIILPLPEGSSQVYTHTLFLRG